MSRDDAFMTRLDGIFFRLAFREPAARVLDPARSDEGRSHYAGQPALYLSATPEGTVVALRRYLRSDDPERSIFPLHVHSDRIVDLRDPGATGHFGIDVTHRAAEWQDWRKRGERPPTWDISDRVRALGLHGMVYASRTRPDLCHLTLFRWNGPDGATVGLAGPGTEWPGPAGT